MKNIYEVKAPLWIRLFTIVGYIALCIAMTFDVGFSILDLWQSKDLIGTIGLVFFFFVLPIYILIALFTKTIFTETGIIHTNFMLMKTRKTYADIETVEITGRSDIRLHFADGTSVRVLTGQKFLSKTVEVLEEHMNLSLKK